jgi:hypothetical protein
MLRTILLVRLRRLLIRSLLTAGRNREAVSVKTSTGMRKPGATSRIATKGATISPDAT